MRRENCERITQCYSPQNILKTKRSWRGRLAGASYLIYRVTLQAPSPALNNTQSHSPALHSIKIRGNTSQSLTCSLKESRIVLGATWIRRRFGVGAAPDFPSRVVGVGPLRLALDRQERTGRQSFLPCSFPDLQPHNRNDIHRPSFPFANIVTCFSPSDLVHSPRLDIPRRRRRSSKTTNLPPATPAIFDPNCAIPLAHLTSPPTPSPKPSETTGVKVQVSYPMRDEPWTCPPRPRPTSTSRHPHPPPLSPTATIMGTMATA